MNIDPELISGEGVTLSQAMSMGGETIVIGLSIVFGVLLILMCVLYVFGLIFNKKPKKTEVSVPAEAAAPVVEEPAEEDEEELIAILTAAVAASLNTSTYNLKIKSYRRISDNRPAWNRAGLRETIGNRL
ncbi:MAG: OadG family protein [Clostridiales bacterium]|nr:OadG family protein [Clostridiales bacterium]